MYEPGAIIGDHYRLLDLLSNKGESSSWQALDIRADQIVIVSLIEPLEDGRNVTQHLAKMALLKELNHPNIETILDFGTHNDSSAFVVTEFLEGQTLASRINEQGVFSFQDLANITDQVLIGLIALHKVGLAHGSLEPGTIFLSKHEKCSQARLISSDHSLFKDISIEIAKREQAEREKATQKQNEKKPKKSESSNTQKTSTDEKKTKEDSYHKEIGNLYLPVSGDRVQAKVVKSEKTDHSENHDSSSKHKSIEFGIMVPDNTAAGPIEEFVEAAELALEGISAFQASSFVPGEINPESIFLISREQTLDVKLIGLSSSWSNSNIDKEISKNETRSLIRALSFMAPEQIFGQKKTDHRSDICSLCAILFATISGRVPYNNWSAEEARKWVGSRQRIVNKSKIKEIPVSLWNIIRRSLANVPALRPQNGEHLRKVLKNSLKEIPDPSGLMLPIGATQEYFPRIRTSGKAKATAKKEPKKNKDTKKCFQEKVTEKTEIPQDTIEDDNVEEKTKIENWDTIIQRKNSQEATQEAEKNTNQNTTSKSKSSSFTDVDEANLITTVYTGDDRKRNTNNAVDNSEQYTDLMGPYEEDRVDNDPTHVTDIYQVETAMSFSVAQPEMQAREILFNQPYPIISQSDSSLSQTRAASSNLKVLKITDIEKDLQNILGNEPLLVVGYSDGSSGDSELEMLKRLEKLQSLNLVPVLLIQPPGLSSSIPPPGMSSTSPSPPNASYYNSENDHEPNFDNDADTLQTPKVLENNRNDVSLDGEHIISEDIVSSSEPINDITTQPSGPSWIPSEKRISTHRIQRKGTRNINLPVNVVLICSVFFLLSLLLALILTREFLWDTEDETANATSGTPILANKPLAKHLAKSRKNEGTQFRPPKPVKNKSGTGTKTHPTETEAVTIELESLQLETADDDLNVDSETATAENEQSSLPVENLTENSNVSPEIYVSKSNLSSLQWQDTDEGSVTYLSLPIYFRRYNGHPRIHNGRKFTNIVNFIKSQPRSRFVLIGQISSDERPRYPEKLGILRAKAAKNVICARGPSRRQFSLQYLPNTNRSEVWQKLSTQEQRNVILKIIKMSE